MLCCIFPWNDCIYIIGHTCRLGRLLGVFNKCSGRRTPYRAVGSAGVAMLARVKVYLWDRMICQSITVLVVSTNVCFCWIKGIFVVTRYGQADILRGVSDRGRPLTSRGVSAWAYRVTTKYSFYIHILESGLKHKHIPFQPPFVTTNSIIGFL